MWLQRWGIIAGAVAWLAGLAFAALLGWQANALVPLGVGGALLCGAIALMALSGRRGAGATAEAIAITLLLVGLAALGMARLASVNPTNDPANVARLIGTGTWEVRGTVSGEPDLRAKGEFVQVAITSAARVGYGNESQPLDGTVQVYVPGVLSQFAPDYGDTVRFTVTLRPPTHAPPGIDAEAGSAQRLTILARGGGNPVLGALYRVREALAGGLLSALPAPEAALLIGILLGLKTPTLRARLPLFVETGTIHLVVTSGLKVTLVAEIVGRLARPLGRALGPSLALSGVVGYVVLSGAGPAAIRAGTMGAILILARALGREYDVTRALALACFLMTLAQPTVLWDVGFQLSAAGTLGIAILGERLRAPLHARLGQGRLGRVTADVLAATLAAQIATFPIVALNFGIISFVSLPANLLLVPPLPLLLVVAMVVAVAGATVPALGGILRALLWPLARAADAVVEVGAHLPGAYLAVGGIPAWLTPLWVIALGCVPLLWRAPARSAAPPVVAGLPRPLRVAVALTLALALFAGTVGASAVAAGTRTTVTFLDVGAGGPATLVRLASGRVVLIDGGADGTALLNALAGALPPWGRTIDLVIVTEARGGHFTGLAALLNAFHIGEVADPGALHPTRDYTAWYADLQAAHIPLVRLRAGDTITPDAATRMEVLAPATLLPTSSGQEETNALVLRLVTPGLRVLFAGEADDAALARAAAAGDVRAEVVHLCQLPTDGILFGSGQADLLRLANPALVVVAPSARAAHPVGTPITPDDPAAIPGMAVIRTTQGGTLTLATDDAGWWIDR